MLSDGSQGWFVALVKHAAMDRDGSAEILGIPVVLTVAFAVVSVEDTAVEIGVAETAALTETSWVVVVAGNDDGDGLDVQHARSEK